MQGAKTKNQNTTKSKELYKIACDLMPGGVNSPVRSFQAVGMEPLFISKAQGQYLYDIDNNKYIDYIMSWGALINGHSNPKVKKGIEEALENGTSFGAPHEKEIELCQLITKKFPSIEKIRLVNSGTEAVMTAIRLARAFTKKNKIIKFEGCYHGHFDPLLSKSGSGITTLGIPTSAGITKSTANEVITLPYNDLNSIEITLSKYPKEIAGVIIEPVIGNSGVIIPENGYLERIRELTQKFDTVLIFDEVITGCRLAPGGASEKYNIKPDLTVLGKIIGGGLPIGVVGGKQEIMNLLAPIGPAYQAGTFSGNPISTRAGIENIKLLNSDSYTYLENLCSILCEEINIFNKKEGFKIQVNNIASMFSIFFTDKKVFNYSTALTSNTKLYSIFFQKMLNQGIYLAPSQFEANFISCAHKEEDIKKTIDAYKLAIKEIF